MVVFGQSAPFGGTGQKVFLTVPMIGAGTWDDPKRPAVVRESGVSFRFQISDDGNTALVEVSPRNLAEIQKLEDSARKEARAQLFRPEKDAQSDALAAFKRLKKDFDPDTFSRPAPPAAVIPGPAN